LHRDGVHVIEQTSRPRAFGRAWVALTAVLAAHVADEALTGPLQSDRHGGVACALTTDRGKISSAGIFFSLDRRISGSISDPDTGARIAQSSDVAGFGEHPIAHIVAGPAPTALPGYRSAAATTSIAAHVVALMLAAAAAGRIVSGAQPGAAPTTLLPDDTPRHVVFLAQGTLRPSSGGGGGGNRQREPIRRAEASGRDRATLRVAKAPAVAIDAIDAPALAPAPALARLSSLVLDAAPLASGVLEQVGLPSGGVPLGTSTGPGSGGGVGDGIGTGIGSGRGPGLGAGSGGGSGGGVYRPGGGVTSPRVIKEVKPTYTALALADRIQGSVVLAFIVQANGVPGHVRVARSLDPGGLDEQAMAAVSQWRFEPGRLAGHPVDVVVTVILDFTIH